MNRTVRRLGFSSRTGGEKRLGHTITEEGIKPNEDKFRRKECASPNKCFSIMIVFRAHELLLEVLSRHVLHLRAIISVAPESGTMDIGSEQESAF